MIKITDLSERTAKILLYVHLKTEILVWPKYFTHTTGMYIKQHEASEKLVKQM